MPVHAEPQEPPWSRSSTARLGVMTHIVLRRSCRGSGPGLWRGLGGQRVELFSHSEAFVSCLNHRLSFLDHEHAFNTGWGSQPHDSGCRSYDPCRAGCVPKSIARTLSRPRIRTNSCMVQYIRISTTRRIWMAQKCGHTISASNFWLPATKLPASFQK